LSNPQTLDDILEICKETPLKVNAPPDSLHNEVKALEEVFEFVLQEVQLMLGVNSFKRNMRQIC